MHTALDIQSFLQQSNLNGPVFDVRSPSEFAQGHIPGAFNLILFNDEERAQIGTLYKQKNRQEAVLRGLEIVAPKLTRLISEAEKNVQGKEIYIHCWRGGMRSGFVAQLLDMYGFKVYTLKGGYKTFRNFVLNGFSLPYKFYILGGKTGSGKTFILEKLREKKEQIINLEFIANHKGSAFGALGQAPQPSQEQFENILFTELFFMNKEKPIWLEDESKSIGKNMIPNPIREAIRSSKVFFLDIPFEERLNHILNEYGKFDKQDLKNSILKITKRLGGEQTKIAIDAIDANDFKTAFDYCLRYYDKTYTFGLESRVNPDVLKIEIEKFSIDYCTEILLQKVNELK
ncbi:MAG: tRNA 2-selenouridine(34) synthase MnmH [Sphingobacteriaceae bacterium]|nr:tRNA 2-selenouridine(34) synthase MnmH [Sphingobacteriaceae bacterium]